MIESFNLWTNSSIIDAFSLYWATVNSYLLDSVIILSDSKNKNLLSIFDILIESFYFEEFQYTLFKALLLILCTNFFLIFVAWRVYGKRICDRFMKPATNKAIEELKASVSKLKLPKEHTPRI